MIYMCDFCGNSDEVIRTNYGSSHYVRLICKKCKKRIEEMDGVQVHDLDQDERKRYHGKRY